MTIGVIATLTVVAGKNAEFEEIFTRLAAQVNASEAGCTFYQLHKSRDDLQVYKVLEQYTDQAALEAHGKTDYFRAAGKELAGCMAAAPQLEFVDGV